MDSRFVHQDPPPEILVTSENIVHSMLLRNRTGRLRLVAHAVRLFPQSENVGERLKYTSKVAQPPMVSGN